MSEDNDKPIVIVTDEGETVDAGGIIEDAATELREELAALAHDMWSGWMRYMFKEQTRTDEYGDTYIRALAVERWQRQMTTPYAELSEEEKESDRKEAMRMIAVMAEFGRTMRMVADRAVE